MVCPRRKLGRFSLVLIMWFPEIKYYSENEGSAILNITGYNGDNYLYKGIDLPSFSLKHYFFFGLRKLAKNDKDLCKNGGEKKDGTNDCLIYIYIYIYICAYTY
jgi:hypothetical protein